MRIERMVIAFDGHDRDGYDMWGFNPEGFNKLNIHRDTKTKYDAEGYDRSGLNNKGFDRQGYDSFGFNVSGFNRKGFGRDGYNKEGYDNLGLNRDGLYRDGFDRTGFNIEGYNREGFARDGFNLEGYNKKGFKRDGFNRKGFDQLGFNSNGINQEGFGRDGYNNEGYDKQGFNRDGLNSDGYDKSGFDIEGINREGFGRTGYNLVGYDKKGFNRDGFNEEGFDRTGFNFEGYDQEGFGRDGFDHEGYDRNDCNADGINRNGYISLAKWVELIKTIDLPPVFINEWSSEDTYLLLDEDDKALATHWANAESDNDYTMARMLSARAAEKITLKFYESLGFSVNDVSIKQLDTHNNQLNRELSDWKLYDLLLDNNISIDVKNARTPFNSKVTYVEHCISRFKNNRHNYKVIIAGVLSPYLKLSDIVSPYYLSNDAIVKYLGETTIAIINKLQNKFSNRLLTISMDVKNFIPRWLFEFPDKFYEQRNQYRLNLQKVSIEHTPTIEYLRQNSINPIPIYLSSGMNLPNVWKDDLKEWQIKLYDRILIHKITMPFLFLALLTHFLEILTDKDKWNEYEPNLYRELFYADLSKDEHPQMPLGIFDPLGTISDFIETLSTLWSHRESANLDNFELFKFNGVGLLEGKKFNQQKHITILAYCGGFVEGRGKCGNIPLIVGEHQSCPECGKLICDKCGHCSSSCPLCAGRMKETSGKGDEHIEPILNPFDSDDAHLEVKLVI